MKTTLNRVPYSQLPQILSKQALLLAVVLALAGGAMTARAQTTVVKANNYTSLVTGSDWVGSTAPGANNIAVWNSTATSPALEPLGANTTWEGIQILNPGGPVITTWDGNTLTNGAIGAVGLTGIDMSSASQNLTLSNNVVVNGVQNWKVAAGQTLSLDGNLLYSPASALRIYLPSSTANVYLTNGVANGLLGNASDLGNGYFATLNDTDMVGLVSSGSGLQVVGGSSISGLYTINTVGGGTPTDNGTFTVADFVTNTPGIGWRTSGSTTMGVAYFNEPQIYNSTVVYNGVTYPAWQISHSSSRNITFGTWLITTNVGNSAVYDNGGGLVVQGNGGPTGASQDMRIIQNNTAAPLILANAIHAGSSSPTPNIVKLGPGLVSLQANENQNSKNNTVEVYEGTFEVDNGGYLTESTVQRVRG